MQKNKHFQSDEYINKYNKEREKTARLLIILIVIINIIIFNVNSFNSKNEVNEKNESESNTVEPVVNVVRDNNKKIENLNSLSKILYESRVYDFSLDEDKLYFKFSGIYSDNFILELSKDSKFDIASVIYNDAEDYIEIRGRLV